MIKRSGIGALLILVVTVLFILGVVLFAQAYLGGNVGDQVKRNLRVEEARMLADSAVDEAAARIALETGGAQKTATWTSFHDKTKDAFDVPVPALPAFLALLKSYPMHREPAPVVTARVLFQRFFDRPVTRLALHEDRFGTLEITATVPYTTERGTSRLKLVKRFEFKTVHLVPPGPWDHTQFYVHAPDSYLHRGTAAEILPGHVADDVNQLLVDAGFTVQTGGSELKRHADAFADLKRQVDDARAKVGAPAGLDGLSQQLGRVEAAFRAAQPAVEQSYADVRTAVDMLLTWRVGTVEPTLFGLPQVTYLFPGKDLPEYPADDLNLPGIATRLTLPFKALNQKLAATRADFERIEAAIKGGNTSVDIEPPGLALLAALTARITACRAVVDGYAAFQKRVIQRRGAEETGKFERWFEALVERAWINSPAGGDTKGVGALHPGKAQFVIASLTELHTLLDRYGPPFQGVVMVDNAGQGELVLDGAKAPTQRWAQFEGRLLLVVTGDLTLRDVKRKDPAQHLLTTVCFGKLTLGGAVESSIIAQGSLVQAAGAPPPRITGNLVLKDSVFAASNGVDALKGVVLVKDERLAYWAEGAGSKPEYDTVLFSPAPVYVGVTRQVN